MGSTGGGISPTLTSRWRLEWAPLPGATQASGSSGPVTCQTSTRFAPATRRTLPAREIQLRWIGAVSAAGIVLVVGRRRDHVVVVAVVERGDPLRDTA